MDNIKIQTPNPLPEMIVNGHQIESIASGTVFQVSIKALLYLVAIYLLEMMIVEL